MAWFTKLLKSSLGKKVVMSLTGLFLIIFLVVHLVGNLQLLANDGGEKFNLYTEFMTTSPIIKTISYGLYLFIIIHAIQGILLMGQNRAARASRYLVKHPSKSTFASRNMGPLGVIILVFILVHMWQFWFQMKIGSLDMVTYEGHEPVRDLYTVVDYAFSQWWYVLFYVLSMVVIAFHLLHGFQSAFQSLGLNHKKYTPVIKTLGRIYSVVVPLGFAIIPIYFFFAR